MIIYRSDFAGNKDSEGKEYFDSILSSLGVEDEYFHTIDSVSLDVQSYNVFDEDGEKFYPGITNTELMELGGI